MDTFTLDPSNIRDISGEVLGADGRMRVLPAAYWAGTTASERALFGRQRGIYSFPTVELVEHLRGIIGDRQAIEIGAGHGVLAQALGIPATDNREQEKPAGRLMVALQGQPPVRYGPNVVDAHASRAVRRYRPQVVIGCWVTQTYIPGEAWNHDSKLDGIDDADILRHCETYILIGNEAVHGSRRIWARPHVISYPPYLYSRAQNGSREFLAMWQGRGALKRPRAGRGRTG